MFKRRILAIGSLIFICSSIAVAGCTTSPAQYYGIDLKAGELVEAGDYGSLAALVRLAQSGDKQAQFDLGIRFEEGDGVPVNRSAARELYEEAAKDTQVIHASYVAHGGAVQAERVFAGFRRGLPEAASPLSGLLADNRDKSIVSLPQRACRLGGASRYRPLNISQLESQSVLNDPCAQFELGRRFENAQGVGLDIEAARKYYQMAAASDGSARGLEVAEVQLKRWAFFDLYHTMPWVIYPGVMNLIPIFGDSDALYFEGHGKETLSFGQSQIVSSFGLPLLGDLGGSGSFCRLWQEHFEQVTDQISIDYCVHREVELALPSPAKQSKKLVVLEYGGKELHEVCEFGTCNRPPLSGSSLPQTERLEDVEVHLFYYRARDGQKFAIFSN